MVYTCESIWDNTIKIQDTVLGLKKKSLKGKNQQWQNKFKVFIKTKFNSMVLIINSTGMCNKRPVMTGRVQTSKLRSQLMGNIIFLSQSKTLKAQSQLDDSWQSIIVSF